MKRKKTKKLKGLQKQKSMRIVLFSSLFGLAGLVVMLNVFGQSVQPLPNPDLMLGCSSALNLSVTIRAPYISGNVERRPRQAAIAMASQLIQNDDTYYRYSFYDGEIAAGMRGNNLSSFQQALNIQLVPHPYEGLGTDLKAGLAQGNTSRDNLGNTYTRVARIMFVYAYGGEPVTSELIVEANRAKMSGIRIVYVDVGPLFSRAEWESRNPNGNYDTYLERRLDAARAISGNNVSTNDLNVDIISRHLGSPTFTEVDIISQLQSKIGTSQACNPGSGDGGAGEGSGGSGTGTGGTGDGSGGAGQGSDGIGDGSGTEGEGTDGTGTGSGPTPTPSPDPAPTQDNSTNPSPMPAPEPTPNPAPAPSAAAADEPDPAPAPSGQGNEIKPPDAPPSPFFDGREYLKQSLNDTIGITGSAQSPKTWLIAGAIAIPLIAGGYLTYRRFNHRAPVRKKGKVRTNTSKQRK